MKPSSLFTDESSQVFCTQRLVCGIVITFAAYLVLQGSLLGADDSKQDASDCRQPSPLTGEGIVTGKIRLFVPGYSAGGAWTAGSLYESTSRMSIDSKDTNRPTRRRKKKSKHNIRLRSHVRSVITSTLLAWNLPCDIRSSSEISTRGEVGIDEDGTLNLGHGWIQFPSASAGILHGIQQSKAFTVTAVVTSQSVRQSGPARILSCSRDTNARNFTLGQDGEHFVFRVRTCTSDLNGTRFETRIPQVKAGQQQIVSVAYANGNLICSVDGKVVVTRPVEIDFDSWERFPVLAANEHSGDRPWFGKIHSMAVFGKIVGHHSFHDQRSAHKKGD